MSKPSLIGREPNSFSRARPSARMPEPASRTISSPSARISMQLVLPPKRTVSGPGTGIDPRTPQIFRREDDPDVADISGWERVCHATAARQEFLPDTLRLVGGPSRQQKSCLPFRLGRLMVKANFISGALT